MAHMTELLAPAGTPDALRAAIAAGADAVYLGLGAFNARSANDGLTLDELRAGCILAHAHGARVYVTLNACLHDDELPGAVALAGAALGAGADALIAADLGLLARLRREMPGAELHLSTQAGAQSACAVRLAARELGVSRVTCARELSLDELAGLCATGVPIEAFCHGAICICYSGACAYSALMRGRSANRGDCTQPCRLAYELQDGQGRVLAGGVRARRERSDGDRLLCPRDYLGIRHVGALVRAGVASLKVEGRMKSPDYVYNVVRCYRVALDAARRGAAPSARELDMLEMQLARSFNRGFSDGYLRGGHAATGASLMSIERAINQGLEVGRVEERIHDGICLSITGDIAAGDMLEIRSTPTADVPADVPKRWPIVACPVDARAGERVFVRCKRRVEPGSAVHVVRSEGLIAAAGTAIRAMRDEEESLCRDAGVPSVIRVASAYDELRFAHVRRASPLRRDAEHHTTSPAAADALCRPAVGTRTAETGPSSVVSGPVAPIGHAPAAPRTGPSPAVSGAPRLTASTLDAGPAAPAGILDLGEVCRASDIDAVHRACEAVARGEAEAVLCRNIGQIEVARRMGVPWEVAAPLTVWNAVSARLLQDLGARRIWLSEELDEAHRARIRAAAALRGVSIPLLATPACSTPLMVLEHCLLTAEGPCSHVCESCPRRLASERGERVLLELDRNSSAARLAVRVDARGRTRLYRQPEGS